MLWGAESRPVKYKTKTKGNGCF